MLADVIYAAVVLTVLIGAGIVKWRESHPKGSQ